MNNTYDIVEAIKVIEEELIASMIRNMRHHKAEETEMGFEWTQWQVEQLKALERYKHNNREVFGKEFKQLNARMEALIRAANVEGGMEQEIEILEAIKNGFKGYYTPSAEMTAQFFRQNNEKLEALIQATTNDMQKAETAILRMADDQYRKSIYNAMVYANAGGTTYEKAVDMATRDMLAAGLNCIEFSNGARHTLPDYADMAIRTATKRAYLQGEGTKRQEWGVTTVILKKRGNACPKCLPWVGKILIDDVWSGAASQPEQKYPLMSQAIASGLYHPRCKDIHTTYFEGISSPPDSKWTQSEIAQMEQENKQEVREQYMRRQQEKSERLARYSLDQENQEKYLARASEWQQKYNEGHILHDPTNRWDMTAKRELLKDEESLSTRKTETAVVYDANGKFLFQRRGKENEVAFSLRDFFKLKGTVVTHNHPSGLSFSAEDIQVLQNGQLAELRAITEEGVFYIRPPKKWSTEINSPSKIKKIIEEIKKDVVQQSQKVYNRGEIDQTRLKRLMSDEVIKIFSERYGLEYGWETFGNYGG